jgi:RNase P/RNase MRP subunit POP5
MAKTIAQNIKNKNKQTSTQKVLLPTLKEQQRYIVYKVIDKSDGLENVDFQMIHEKILGECSVMLGIFDGAKAGIMSAKFHQKTKKGIIRINNKYVDKLKVCLGLIKNVDINNKKFNIIIDCIYVSGMLNKAEDSMNDIKN